MILELVTRRGRAERQPGPGGPLALALHWTSLSAVPVYHRRSRSQSTGVTVARLGPTGITRVESGEGPGGGGPGLSLRLQQTRSRFKHSSNPQLAKYILVWFKVQAQFKFKSTNSKIHLGRSGLGVAWSSSSSLCNCSAGLRVPPVSSESLPNVDLRLQCSA
jgi:hypothetical protein